MTSLSERSCFKITFINGNSITIPDSLACDLAQKKVIALKFSDNQGWSSLGMSEIGKRERDYDDVSLYKSRQASSSSSMSQSFLREDSLAMELSIFFLAFLVFRRRTNCKTSSRDASETSSISLKISSFLLINHLFVFLNCSLLPWERQCRSCVNVLLPGNQFLSQRIQPGLERLEIFELDSERD